MSRRAFVATGLALAGCAGHGPPLLAPAISTTRTPTVTPAPNPFQELEPLLAYRPTPYGLAITVASRGCTTRADFVFYVEHKPEGARIAFARRRLDRCAPPAHAGVELFYGWAELGLSPLFPVLLLNPVEPRG